MSALKIYNPDDLCSAVQMKLSKEFDEQQALGVHVYVDKVRVDFGSEANTLADVTSPSQLQFHFDVNLNSTPFTKPYTYDELSILLLNDFNSGGDFDAKQARQVKIFQAPIVGGGVKQIEFKGLCLTE